MDSVEEKTDFSGLLGGLQPVITAGGGIYPMGLSASPNILGVDIPEPATPDELVTPIGIAYDAASVPSYRLPAYSPDPFLRQQGIKKLNDLKTMGSYNSPLNLVKNATLFKPWKIRPVVNNEQVTTDHPRYEVAYEVAKFCSYVLNNIYDEETDERQTFRDRLWYLLDAIHIGYSALQIQTRTIQDGEYKGKWGLQRLIWRSPQSLGFNIDPVSSRVYSLNIRSPFLWQDNIPLNEFILYTFRATDELPYGDGLARSCFKHVYAMLEGYRIWQKGVERFASGLLDVTTTNNDTNYLNRTKNAFDEIRQASTIVHGKDIELNLVMPSGASGDLWLNFIDHHRASIVRIILGQELTTGQGMGKGSWSLGEVHRGTEKYFLSQPRADLESIITKQLLTRLVMWNYGPDYMDVVPQLFMGFIDHEENGIFAEYMDIFTKLGVTWATEPWIREQANFQPLDSKTLDDPLLAENVVKKIIETHSDKVGQTNKDVSTGESASAE